jgi:hypothetical protein
MLIFLNRPALKSNGSSATEAYNHMDSKVVAVHAVRAHEGLIGSVALTLCTIVWGGGWSSSCSCRFVMGGKPPPITYSLCR